MQISFFCAKRYIQRTFGLLNATAIFMGLLVLIGVHWLWMNVVCYIFSFIPFIHAIFTLVHRLPFSYFFSSLFSHLFYFISLFIISHNKWKRKGKMKMKHIVILTFIQKDQDIVANWVKWESELLLCDDCYYFYYKHFKISRLCALCVCIFTKCILSSMNAESLWNASRALGTTNFYELSGDAL